MIRLKNIGILLLTAALFLTCKKNQEPDPITFSGTVSDPVQGIPVAGATVKIMYQQSANNNVFNSGFTTGATVSTDANGNYSVTFSPENPVTYRIVAEKNLYFSQETQFSNDNVSAGSTQVTNFSLSPIGWLRVNIKNVNPVDASDVILYQNTSEGSGCSSCCTNAAINFTGTNVDTSLLCQRISYPDITFSWFVTKNGNLVPYSGSTTGIVGDTVVYTINY